MRSSGLFGPIFAPEPLWEAVSDHAWLAAMLEAEAALAAPEHRDAIRSARLDIDAIGRAAPASGNPVVPLVRALTESLPEEAARHVHRGATSQDILDTAAMLVSKRARDLILAELDGVADACAQLADEHRSTVMVARTLLQPALPTTFGLKAAGWLHAVGQARSGLAEVQLPAQLGGPVGTLVAYGDGALEKVRAFAHEVGLDEPLLPWHGDRSPVARLAFALDLASGAVAKIALDVQLLSQGEVGEVAEPEPGGSSSMSHKRNPVGSTRTRACARRVHALAGMLTAVGGHEHERAAGAWHAEWQPLSEALALTGGAAAAMRRVLEGLELDADRMRANLDLLPAGARDPGPSIDALIDRALESHRR
ncbi:MAG: 3-carboxy-cis,cis-muconate cycloisomerase [Thermoleophilaceae bacterium]|nr:3-carboxy-cis,cis-muconate cycloisomerase [Thermoleophilaceae bacterium]